MGGGHEKSIYRGDCLKRGRERLDSLLIQGGLGKNEGGRVFERGIGTPMPTMRQALKG